MAPSTKSDLEGLVERLHQLGLDEEEARLYVTLRLMGPARASQLAEATRIARQQVYRGLEQLTSRGFVTASLHRPALYQAVPPNDLFASLARTAQEQLERVKTGERETSPIFSALERRSLPKTVGSTFNVIEGRREVVEFAIQQHFAAQESLSLCFLHPKAEAILVQSGTLERFLSRAEEGVECRIIGPSDSGFLDVLRTTAGHARFQRRILRPDHFKSFLVVDRKQVLVNAGTDLFAEGASSNRIAIHTDAPGVVRLLDDYFERLWTDASPEPLPAAAPSNAPQEPA